MLFKNLLVIFLMTMYLYTLAFGIFMTSFFRIPAPVIFCFPLMLFYNVPVQRFAYWTETVLFTIALTLYYLVGQNDFKYLILCIITIGVCALYFNYFVGFSQFRFKLTVIIFFALLFFSMLLMVLDHNYQSIIDPLRSLLLGEPIKQSPAGLALTQFVFGYQIVAFTAFILVLTATLRFNLLIIFIVFLACMAFIYLGMNRSALISFAVSVAVFLFVYYWYKAAVLFIGLALVMGVFLYTYALKNNTDQKNNILAKNQAKQANDFNRLTLASENLAIYSNYPFGLMFYGKSWEEVTYRNPVFPDGLSSHNAYLMFLTYLGPFLGLGLLGAIYYRINRLYWITFKHIKLKPNAILVSLLFSLLAVSFNAFSHNGWLLSADGPTLFLYYGVLQGSKIYL
ncbi:MAG: O-Antigen ligase [Mucilaginibacter sp.]|nr:O-Antigen ligase [Mucilaginibacter sp.]